MASDTGQSGTAPAQISQWTLAEFEEMNEIGRTLYTQFYHLATMTFTWNASLATAIILLEENKDQSTNTFILGLRVAIPIVALIYNAGAFEGFRFVYSLFFKLSLAMGHLDLPSNAQISKNFDEVMRGQIKGNYIIPLTIAFFFSLILIWLFALIVEILGVC